MDVEQFIHASYGMVAVCVGGANISYVARSLYHGDWASNPDKKLTILTGVTGVALFGVGVYIISKVIDSNH
jgi:uncharacterized membrane protein